MLNYEERVLHYKMYKAKKRWLFAGMGVLLMSGALMMGSGVTARADDTPQTGEPTAQVPTGGTTSTVTNPADAQKALDEFTDYKTGGYQDAVDQFQQDSQTIDSAKSQYDDQEATYENELTQYNAQVADQTTKDATDHPVTSNPKTKAQLDDTYNTVKQDYDALKDQQTNVSNQIETANQNLTTAQAQLAALHDKLPDSVKAAGSTVAKYNANTDTQAKKLVADSTTQAYSKALKVYPSGLTKMMQDVQGLADNSPVKVSAKLDTDANGKVQATLYGKTYQDKNGDGKITYEEDVLPAAIADLTNDLKMAQSGQTDKFTGSYPEIIALFTYLKQVGDTALPYQTEDGTTGRIESGLANTASTALSTNGSLTAGYLSTTYANSLLQTIEGTKADVESTVKGIWDSTGLPFDQTKFDQSFDQTLKEQAILIYKQQTDELLNTAQTVLAAFKQADKDPLWIADALGVVAYPTKELTARLQTAIDNLQQQITDGTAALAKVPASDNFLSIAYSQGDAASGFDKDTQTISSLWNTLYHNAIDAYGMSVSPLMKTVMPNAAKSDPDTKTETVTTTSGQTVTNTIYSPKFIADHQAIFDAATTLSDAVTDLTVQSAEIANNFEDVLNSLLTIPDQFDTTLPDQIQPIQPLTDAESTLAPQPVTLNPVNLTLTYMDDGTVVESNTQSVDGNDDGTVTWTATVPDNYQLAAEQAFTGRTEIGQNADITVTIQLAHQHVTSTVTQNVITQFVAGDGVQATALPKTDTQQITWTVDQDKVTKDWTATPDKTRTNAVDAPVIYVDGTTAYVPDITSVAGVTATPISGTDDPTAQLADATRTVTYFAAQLPGTGVEVINKGVVSDTPPSAKSYPVQYVDDNGTVVGTGDFVGTPGDIVNAKVPAGYTLAQGQTDSQTIGETTTITFRVTMPSSGAGEVVTPGDGEQTVVPDGDNDGESAGDNEVETDAGGTAVTEGTDGQTSGTPGTTQIGQTADGGQASGTSQTVNAGTVTQSSGQAGTVVGTKKDTQQGATTKGQLPQTNETKENAAAGLGVLGLSLLMSVLGLKKRKRD